MGKPGSQKTTAFPDASVLAINNSGGSRQRMSRELRDGGLLGQLRRRGFMARAAKSVIEDVEIAERWHEEGAMDTDGIGEHALNDR